MQIVFLGVMRNKTKNILESYKIHKQNKILVYLNYVITIYKVVINTYQYN